MKYFFIVLSIVGLDIFYSCGYHKDRLNVSNLSNRTVCYETAVYDPLTEKFYLAPAGDSISVGKSKSPAVKGSVRDKMLKQEYDRFLYIYFFSCDKRESFWSNTDSFIKNIDTSKVRVLKLSESQLDNLDWKILFRG